jgi:hypothetical protein
MAWLQARIAASPLNVSQSRAASASAAPDPISRNETIAKYFNMLALK